ncbi:hypothetical protein VULLAG_LOCUS10278 [Vulpes lagopus]
MQLAISILSQRAVPGSSSVHTIQGPPHCPARIPHFPTRSSVPAGDYLPVETGRALWVQPPQDTWQLRAPATMHEAAGSTGG